MNINELKKKWILLSCALIVIGTIISILGFAIIGFDMNRFRKEASNNVWYQTIHANQNAVWYGISLDDDIHLMIIGSDN